MSGRRSHPRFAVATPWDGAVRVLREIVVQRAEGDRLLAVSHSPGIVGEEMTLDVMAAAASVRLRVKVMDSRPVIVDGSVRHRIGLAMVNEAEIVKEAPHAESAGDTRPLMVSGSAAAAEAV
jgi:hypothetical protein